MRSFCSCDWVSVHLAAVRLAGLLVMAVVGLAIATSGWAQQDDAGDAAARSRIAAQIEAGEFGPAAEAIGKLPDAEQRDTLIGSLAAAQAAAGARQAAYATASDIENYRLYSEALLALTRSPAAPLARGGGPQADFESLIELIETTVAPDTWDAVGGPGALDSFEGGVYVDAAGLMRRIAQRESAPLAELHAAARPGASRDWRVPSTFRKVSLPRLERAVLREYAAGREPGEAMRHLAGMHRVTHVLVYPESGDVVLAGPAGDFRHDAEGRAVSVDSGRPLLRLDDLVVLLRNATTANSRFGCSITPRQQQLAATKAFLQQSAARPLRPGQRDRWLSDLRDTLGRQDITVYGIDPRTQAGRVLIEADYRMKLVGMGLEEGVLGVESYLASLPEPANGAPPPALDVLRWWFTLNYDSIGVTAERNAFELRGKAVQVKSENELLSDLGERVHTGEADELNRRFSHSFTQHFDQLAARYPVYAELQNVFDLAMASAIVVREDLPGQAGWELTHFGPQGDYQAELGPAPKEVETVINHRVLGGKHIVAGVSGGVRVDIPTHLAGERAFQVDEYGLVHAARANSQRSESLAREVWWWD